MINNNLIFIIILIVIY